MNVPHPRQRWSPVVYLALAFVTGLAADHFLLHGAHPRSAAHAQSPATQPALPAAHWLSEAPAAQRDQLEQHLRGLDVAMWEIAHRYDELLAAGHDRNWPFAQYQIEKIELALRLALERRPKRVASARPFLDETVPLFKQAIKDAAAGDRDAYTRALQRLRTDCMKCHVAENVPHFIPGEVYAVHPHTPDHEHEEHDD